MQLTIARIRRLIRAEGLPAEAGLERALMVCPDEGVVRARALALRRARVLSADRGSGSGFGEPSPPSWLEQLDAWQRGGPNAWFDEADRLGLPVSKWLGFHESLLHLVGLTLTRCLKQDLRGNTNVLTRALPTLPALASALCEAAPAGVLEQAQQALFEHPSPGQLTHFCRIWPENCPMDGLRDVYMALTRGFDPGLVEERSVVGCVSLLCSGTDEQRRRLYDWDAFKKAQDSSTEPGGARRLPLLCGVQVPLDLKLEHASARFSAFELIEREDPGPRVVFSSREERFVVEGFDPSTLDQPENPPLFPSVGIMLLTLGRAALGARCPKHGAWIPPLPEVSEASPPPLPQGAQQAFFDEVRSQVALFALYPDTSDAQLRDLMVRFWWLSARDDASELHSGRTRLANLNGTSPESEWVAAWSGALFGLCVWRWRTGLEAILQRLPECASLRQTREFPDVARSWLKRTRVSSPPLSRRRRPDAMGAQGGLTAGGHPEALESGPFNQFDLDPVERPDDVELIHVCLSASPHPAELLAWSLNEWRLAKRFAEILAARSNLTGSDTSGDARAHGSSVWIHHILLERLGRNLDAFKRIVSKEGLVPWSLSEVDEAAEAARPRVAANGRWRSALAEATTTLPTRAWTAAKCWHEGRRTLAWLVEWAGGASGRWRPMP